MKKRFISFACILTICATTLLPSNIVVNAKGIENNNINNISAYATEGTFEVEVDKETSYEITNTTSQSQTIGKDKSNNRFNYIIYNADGTIKDSSYNSSSSSKTIKQNEKIKISAFNGNFKINIPASLSGNTVKLSTPTFSTLTMNLGETYEFTNSNANGFPIRIVDNTDYSNSLRYDSILYNHNNEIDSIVSNKYTLSYNTIKKNYRQKLTMTSGDKPIVFYIPYEYKNCYKKIETSTLYYVNVLKGETYEIENNRSDKLNLKFIDNTDFSNDIRYEFITYNQNNSIDKLRQYEYTVSYNTLTYRQRMKITNTYGSKDMVIKVPYEYKDFIKKSETPTFHSVTIQKGEAYEVENRRSDGLDFKFIDNTDFSNDIRYEFITYNQNNSIDKLKQYEYTVSYNRLIYRQRMKITSTYGSKDMIIKVPYEYKEFIKKSETPTFHSVTIKKGDTYEIENKKKDLLDLKFIDNTSFNNDRRYNYIKYDKSNNIGSISEYKYSGLYDSLKPMERKKLTFSYGSSDMVIKIPYEDKDCIKKSEIPTFFNLTLNKGDTYTITNWNKDRTDIRMLDNSSNSNNDIRYDYVRYYDDNKIGDLGSNVKSGGNTQITYSKSLKLTFTEGSENMVITLPYEFKDSIKKDETPALSKVNIKQGETFEIKNNTPNRKDIKIIDNSLGTYSDIRYDFLSYDKYNRPDRALSNIKTKYEINVSPEKSIKITPTLGSKDMVVYIPYEYKDYIKKSKTPAFYYTTINKGESYEVYNKLNDEKSIAITDNSSELYSNLRYDYTIYDKNGGVSNLKNNALTNDNRIVNDGEKMKFTVIEGSEPFILKVPYEYKDFVKKSNTPALYRFQINEGETYEFKNKTGDGKVIKYWDSSMGDKSIKYDIVEYSKNGDVSYNGCNKYSNGLQSLHPESKLKLTLRDAYNPMEVYLPYEYKDSITKSSTPVFLDKKVEFGKSYEVTNNTLNIKVIYGGVSDYISSFDYDVYNSEGKLLRSRKDFRGNLLLYPNEKVVLKSTNKGDVMFNIQHELTITKFQEEDINKDGAIDMLDLSLVSSKYGIKNTSNSYSINFDLNKDGIIDIYDIVKVAKKI